MVHELGIAGTRLKKLYPPETYVRATALGNALAAAEGLAGARYGWDAVVAWPRLYPLLDDRTRSIVDDRRDSLDATSRLAVMGALTTIATLAVLLRSGYWLTLVLIPAVVTWLAYKGAIRAAVAYGEVVDAAFDLGRFDSLSALHLALPADARAEQELAEALSLERRQGVAPKRSYEHTGQYRSDS